MSPVFGIVGLKDTGKTTLVCALVRELTSRGYRIATVKHAHEGFDIDREGTDSYAHAQAGASEVAIVGSSRWAIVHADDDGPERTLNDMLARLSPSDLVLVEGFKLEPHPKIELRLPDRRISPDRVRNVVAPVGPNEALDREDVSAIANFIIEHLDLALAT